MMSRLIFPFLLSACVACGTTHEEGHEEEAQHPIVLTSAAVMEFTNSEEYVA